MLRENEFASEVKRHREQGAKIILCEQTSPIAEPGRISGGVEVDQVIRFPHLECFALWPQMKFDEERIASIGPERFLRIDRTNIRRSDAKADFTMLEAFEQRFRSTIPFDSPRHPSAILFADLIVKILERLDKSILLGDLASWHARVAASRGIGSAYQHPVRLDFVEAFGCEWSKTSAYTGWRKAAALKTDGAWSELIGVLEAVRRDGVQQPDLLRMIEPALFLDLAIARRMTGDESGFAAALAQGVLKSKNSNSTAIHASVAAQTGRYDEAIALWRQCSENDPANHTCRLNLGELLIARERYGEGIAVLQRLAELWPGIRVWEALGRAHVSHAAQAARAAHAAYGEVKASRLLESVNDTRERLGAVIAELDLVASETLVTSLGSVAK